MQAVPPVHYWTWYIPIHIGGHRDSLLNIRHSLLLLLLLLLLHTGYWLPAPGYRFCFWLLATGSWRLLLFPASGSWRVHPCGPSGRTRRPRPTAKRRYRVLFLFPATGHRLPATASTNAPKCPKILFYPPPDHLHNPFSCNNLQPAAKPFSEILWAILHLTHLACLAAPVGPSISRDEHG